MNECRQILRALLEKYEDSTLYRTGHSKQGIFLRWEKSFLQDREDAPQQREADLAACHHLEREGLIEIRCVPHYEDLIEKLYLITEEEVLQRAYKEAGAVCKARAAQAFSQALSELLKELPDEVPGEDIRAFLQKALVKAQENRAVPSEFFAARGLYTREVLTELQGKNEALCRLLVEMARGEAGGYKRVISQRLFGDSKYLERELGSKLVAILSALEEGTEDWPEETKARREERLLAERGIFSYPEVLELCGPLCLTLDTGEEISLASHRYGAYVNAQTMDHVAELSLPGVRRVLLIENKANYVQAIPNRQEGELFLFHGGFYSPVKGRLFALIAQALPEGARVEHWGDIDLGGFLMHRRLKKEVFTGLRPYRMDEETFVSSLDRAKDLGDEGYRQRLAALLEEEEREGEEEIAAVIQRMLQTGKKIEQEALIWP